MTRVYTLLAANDVGYNGLERMNENENHYI